MHRGETSRPLEKTGLRDGSRFHAGGEAPTLASVMFSPGPSPCIIPHRGSVGLDVPKLNPCEAQCRKFGKMTLPAELLRISCLPFCLPQSWKRLSRLWEDSPPNFLVSVPVGAACVLRLHRSMCYTSYSKQKSCTQHCQSIHASFQRICGLLSPRGHQKTNCRQAH